MNNYKQSFFTAFITAVLVAAVMNVYSVMDSGNSTFTEASLFGKGSATNTVAVDELNDRLATIAEEVNPAVVTVFSVREVKVNMNRNPFARFFGMPQQQPREFEQRGMGSGVIVSDDGYIITNNHVVENADELRVRVKSIDKDLEAELIGTDPKSDVAVLKVKSDYDLPNLKFGDSENLRVGEMVLAVGSPLQETLAHTVTMGIVSAKGRSNLNLAEYEDFIQTDAAINPGNSGGALVNLDGELIGINTAIASRTGGNQGIGFSIPINMAKSIMESLIEYGKVVRGYLGIYMTPLTPELAEALELESTDGVLVQQVVENGPADKAGIESGDVILSMNGQKMESFTQLKNKIATTKPGREIELTVVRNGEEMLISPVLEELETDGSEMKPSDEIVDDLKFNYSNLNDELREGYNVSSEVEQGVVVTGISPSSTAYQKGLREGDVIMSVNRKKIGNVAEFEEIVSAVKKGDVLMMRVARRNVALFIAFNK